MKSSGMEITSNLLADALKYCDCEGTHVTPLPELKVIRRDRTTEASPGMYASVVCLVLQGEKRVWSGKKVYRYNPENYLVSCIDVPATVQVVKASTKQPYVGLTLELQPSVVYEI
ncbi:MAG: AraC family transcriptional regulator, partial [Candidatus Kryptoniota bacterium]